MDALFARIPPTLNLYPTDFPSEEGSEDDD